MPFPKLSPLQSRLAASFIACILVFMLYLALSSSSFAYASEIDPRRSEDYDHEKLFISYVLDGELDGDVGYEAQFYGADRSIIGRADPGIAPLKNNYAQQINIVPGADPEAYVFTNESLWGPLSGPSIGLPSSVLLLEKRETANDINEGLVQDLDGKYLELRTRQLTTRTLYITTNTCLQPSDPNDPTGSKGSPPQIELYVSQTNTNQKPGPNKPDGTQTRVVADGGFANITLQASGDVFIGLWAPNTTNFNNGVYNVEIAASIDAPFHYYNSTQPNLYLVASDASSALLVTNNLTSSTNNSDYNAWMDLDPPPFVIFAANQNRTAFAGVQNSYCGLEKYAQIANKNGSVVMSMTNSTLGPLPKQQFYFQGLNASSSYNGTLAMMGNSTRAGNGVVGGGGQVWKTMSFQTQSDGNCAVIFNLPFCDSVAYAVPGNPKTFSNVSALAAWYDNSAQSQYTFFDYAMQQIPCDIDSTAQYSLARNCTDCRKSYKSWLCSVMIPRCMDYSSTANWLQERNVVRPFPNGTMLDSGVINNAQDALYLNSSRNPNIDTTIQPGPYKEILPCEDLCYDIVRSCPSSMGFSCPTPGQAQFNYSYGQRPNGSPEQEGQITCNYPGAAYHLSAGYSRMVPLSLSVVMAVAISLFLTLKSG